MLDLGCGDGLLGEGLVKRGYTNITGVDFSQPMLDKSAARKATFLFTLRLNDNLKLSIDQLQGLLLKTGAC